MINNISLGGYCYAISISLVFYYACIIKYFCKKDIKAILFGLKKALAHKTSALKPIENIRYSTIAICGKSGENPLCSIDDNTTGRNIQSLLDEIYAFFEQSSLMKDNKNVLTSSLRLVLDKYPHIKVSTYRSLINHLIEIHSLKHCSIHFTNEELELLWKD